MNEGNYLQAKQYSTEEKRARNHNQPTMQQKNIPNKREHTATLTRFYFNRLGASHRHLHKPNEKKKESRLPCGASSLCDRSLSSSCVVPELVPRACTCREPARSDGIVVKGGPRSVPSAQSRDRGLLVSAPGSPFQADDGNRAQEKRRE